jgi:biopolymer transport protein ExbB
MESKQTLNSFAFISQGDTVTLLVALILLVMSVASWYYIVTKAVHYFKLRKELNQYLEAFWDKPTLQAALDMPASQTPAYHLVITAVNAAQHHQQYASNHLSAACSQDEFIVRNIRRTLSQTQAQFEKGLSLLASVGSIAPFVGLFGTVWGIYHALVAIGASGQATIDKVAGPVGEALIMTAIGLAVAIPAVLAYNAYVKANRNVMAQLEHFAQDLHTLLTTGAPLAQQSANVKAPKSNTSQAENVTANTAMDAIKGISA